MFLAKNNIIVKLNDNQTYAILNPITGSFDLMDKSEYQQLLGLNNSPIVDDDFADYLLERGYAYRNEEDHNAAVNQAFAEFKAEIAATPVQLMLVPTYGCNLACTYCFQHGVQEDGSYQPASRPQLINRETVDAFFDYARVNFAGNNSKPFITLFGGEPLVNSPAQRKIISYIVDKCIGEGYELAAVTNGYDFTEYIDILKKAKIKEIQFTLDGSKAVHDQRRATANKKGTFDKIISGIEAAVENSMPVNLRSVVDLENIEDLVHLAEFLDQKGWLDLPPELFKTQIGRNYELFECYAKPQHLMSQAELWGEFAALSKKYPILAKFHRPDFKGIRHLADTGEMYMASFDTCPAAKTEWVFDLYGDIYGCTASCGRKEYLLGKYWPAVNLNQTAVETWQSRNVTKISKCKDCKYDVICGGGCGVVAANHDNGNILAPDCRPIQELLEIGINYYANEIKALGAEEEVALTDAAGCGCHTPPGNAHSSKQSNLSVIKDINNECCTTKISLAPQPENLQEKTEGCLVCGQDLVYSDQPITANCYICGQTFNTYVKCAVGHYVCDRCHSQDFLGRLEDLLMANDEADPIALAKRIFSFADLNMHGPEYHSIVPAIIVRAYQNLTHREDRSAIREAIKRGQDTPGGSCGFAGNCGAAVGSGAAVSIIEGATPMSRRQRGAANRATGQALLAISDFEGPRCCKREAITAIRSFCQNTSYFDYSNLAGYTCAQFGKNKTCIRKRCPYFPIND